MSTKVKKVEIVMKQPELMDGVYDGVWGGYVAFATIGSLRYRFETEDGIRSTGAPCKITVLGDQITVEAV